MRGQGFGGWDSTCWLEGTLLICEMVYFLNKNRQEAWDDKMSNILVVRIGVFAVISFALFHVLWLSQNKTFFKERTSEWKSELSPYGFTEYKALWCAAIYTWSSQ